MIIKKYNSLVTIDIFYFMPVHQHIIQEFVWQTYDITPEMPRVHKFLNYWKNNIDAVIQEVVISYSKENKIINSKWYQKLC